MGPMLLVDDPQYHPPEVVIEGESWTVYGLPEDQGLEKFGFRWIPDREVWVGSPDEIYQDMFLAWASIGFHTDTVRQEGTRQIIELLPMISRAFWSRSGPFER